MIFCSYVSIEAKNTDPLYVKKVQLQHDDTL